MHIFSSTYFDEISIFGLSKGQTFRFWSTFMNPEQFLILVPYLLIIKFCYFWKFDTREYFFILWEFNFIKFLFLCLFLLLVEIFLIIFTRISESI
jgi:hypothetical protein